MEVKKSYYSIIDIGSNTMRLVVYKQEKSLRLHEVENVKSVARLRNHLDEDNMLSHEGIDKLIHTLKSFKEVADTYNLAEFVCVATATVRQAKNKQEIIDRVHDEIGWDLRILSEKEEAYYGYLAVVNSTKIEEGITIDIGGGSTEITYFNDRKLIKAHSFPFGGLTLKQFFQDNKRAKKNIIKLRRFLKKQFNSLDWLKRKSIPLIGIGGSARNLAQIHQNLVEYPLAGLHQYLMSGKSIEQICHYLAGLSQEELEKVEGLSKDRADIILPASLVFLTLYETIHATGFVLSRKGLRDGVFYENLATELEANLYPNVLEDSILELVYEYNLNLEQIKHITDLTQKLFDELVANNISELHPDDWIHLKRGCYVYNLGEYIDSESSSQHTFYLLANRTIDGIMHADRLKMALLASYKNKTIFRQYMEPFAEWFTEKERYRLCTLGSLLKFTYSLDATKRSVIQDFDVTVKKQDIFMTLYCNQDFMPEQYQTEKQKKHLERALKRNIHLRFICHDNNSLN